MNTFEERVMEDTQPKTESASASELFFEAQNRAQQLRESAIKELLAERESHENAIDQINQKLAAAGHTDPEFVDPGVAVSHPSPVMHRATLTHPPAFTEGKRTFSAATKAKMAKAQRARWAAIRKDSKKKGE